MSRASEGTHSSHAHPLPCSSTLLPPESVEVPWSCREWNQRRQALENRHCQMNRPRHIEHVMEPRPPKAQPNGLLERKSETQIISTQRALQGVCAPETAMGMSTVPFFLSFSNSEDEQLGGKDIHLCPYLASVKHSSVARESAALSVEWHGRVSSPTCE